MTVPSPVVLTILLAINPNTNPERIHTIIDMRYSKDESRFCFEGQILP